MAINLFQGADPSLVTSATRAGLASAPPDYSKTFESVAASYDKTMQAQAQMWGNIATAAADIGKAIGEDILTDPPEGTEYILEDLESTQDMLKRSYGLIPGEDGERMNPFSKKARALRREARKERESLFADAEYELQGINAIEAAYSSGIIDPTMTGVQNMERSHAVVATRRGKTTDNGTYFKWEDVDGERKMVMYHDPSKIKKDAKPIEGFPYHMIGDIQTDKDGRILHNGEPIVTNAAEILKGLHGDKINEKTGVGFVKTAKSKSAAAIQDMGFKSTVPFNQLDSHSMAQIQEVVDGEKNNRVSWFTSSFADPGNRSFYDRVTNADNKGGSLISAEMYTEVARLSGLPTDKEGNLQKAGVLKGLKDPSGDGYISQKEFLSQDNIKIFSHSLFGGPNYDAEVTAGLYEQDQLRNFGSLFDGGHNKRTPSVDTPGTTLNPGVYYRTGQGDQKEIGSDITKRFNLFATNKPFKSYDGKFSFEYKDGSWQVTGPSEKSKKITTRPISQYNLSEIMGFNNQSNLLNFDPDKLSRVGGKVAEGELLGEGDDKPGTMLSRILNPSKYFKLK